MIAHHHHHHHSFNVSVPLKVGCMAPIFVLSFFLHSILFAGSALDSFQCLRSLLIVSFHVFFGLLRPRCLTTSNSVMLLIQPSFLTTCPNQRSRLYRNKVCMLLIPRIAVLDNEFQVNVMHKSGNSFWKWPAQEDNIFYTRKQHFLHKKKHCQET